MENNNNQVISQKDIITGIVFIDGDLAMCTLTADGELRSTEYGLRQSFSMKKDVLGFVVEGKQIRVKAVVEKDEGICCGLFGGDFLRKDLVFEPLIDLNGWCYKLRRYLDSLGRPKRLLVFVNPFGGKKSAREIFVKEVKPLFEDADIQLEIQETEYQLHAMEVVKSVDVSKYDGIVCVSGDGVLVEVVNGLLERPDWRTAVKLPIGMVPAGTGNGMIKSLLDTVGLRCCARSATISIIRGHKRSVDVATISQRNTKFFSVLMLAWGLIADIDIESEKFRWMGSARIDFYRIICLRQYNGHILFLPAPGFESYGQPASCSLYREPPVSDKKLGYQGPETKFERLKWREIKGPFVTAWLHNVPWGAENTLAAPDAKEVVMASLLHPVGLPCSAKSATISIIRGRTRSLDVATISQGTTKFFSVLMLAWGLVADIDIESEKFRWMGSARFDIYGLQRILCLRQYSGWILFVPAPGFESYGQPASYSVDKELPVSVKALKYQGPDTKLEDLEWREMKGPFVSVWLHNVPWGAENTLAAPNAKFSDGFLDLIVMKDSPKLALLSLMTKLNDGTHVQSPYASYLKVKAFVLEPGSRIEEPDKEGIIDSDGEVLARGKKSYKCDQKALMSYDKLQITVDQGLATLFSPVHVH